MSIVAGREILRRKILPVLVVLLVASSGLLIYENEVLLSPKPFAQLGVLKTSVDRVDAPSGMTWYLLDVNVTNLESSGNWTFYPSVLWVYTNSSRGVSSSSDYNVTSLLQNTEVRARSSVNGLVAFLLSANEAPLTINWNLCVDNCAGPVSLGAKVPTASAFASRFSYNVHMSINGQPVAAGGWTVVGANSSTPWVSSLILNGVIENTTGFLTLGGKGVEDPSNYVVFFTGQTVQVNLWFEYLKKPADPMTIHLDSVTNDQGFQILGLSPMPPVSMTGWGFQEGFVVLLRVPPGLHSGSLGFSVQASS